MVLIRIVGDDLTEKINVVGGYGTFAVSEYFGYGNNITDYVMDRTFFMAQMIG